MSRLSSTTLIKISIHAPTRGATDPTTQAVNASGISIHAPTRGATHVTDKITELYDISIHAPTRGATSRFLQKERKQLFQSTLLQEERLGLVVRKGLSSLFQSTLLQEERQLFSFRLTSDKLFQSTLLQEERQQKCTIFLMHLCNNYCIVSL